MNKQIIVLLNKDLHINKIEKLIILKIIIFILLNFKIKKLYQVLYIH